MNRQERRRQQKAQKKIKKPAFRGMTREEKIAGLIQNGITVEDLKEEWEDGYKKAYAEAGQNTIKTCYAAFAVAMHEKLGFGKMRIARLLNAADNCIVNYLTTEEIINDVYEKAGLELDFHDGLEPVKERDDAKPWRRK